MRCLIYLFCLFLSACGGGGIPALKSDDALGDDKALIVFRVDLNPKINDEYMVSHDADDTLLYMGLTTTPGNGENLRSKPNEKTDVVYDRFHTNTFFVLEIPAGQKLAIRSLDFWAVHKPYLLANSYTSYYTTLINPSWDIGVTPVAGEKYYLGTLKIDLAERSFAEDEDTGEFDNKTFHFAVPKNIQVVDESASAQKWFDAYHQKIGGKLRTIKITPKNSGRDNVFRSNRVSVNG